MYGNLKKWLQEYQCPLNKYQLDGVHDYLQLYTIVKITNW